MGLYIYTGVKNGKKTKGVLEASSRAEAIYRLKREGIIITEIEEKKGKALKAKDGSGGYAKFDAVQRAINQQAINQQAVKTYSYHPILKILKPNLLRIFSNITLSRIARRDVAVFSRQLASLLKSGMSLTESLDTIAKQTRKISFRYVIMELSEGVKQGKSFSQVLSEHPHIFSEMYIGMVKAGESAGELDKVMEDLGEYLDKQISLRSKISSAMVYPIFVTVVMGVVLWVLLSFVVPKIAQLLEDVGRALPIYTRLLISFSKVTSYVGPYVLLFFGLLFLFRRRILSYPRVRHYFDLVRLRMPIYSRVHLLGELYRIFSTLATLTRAGVPIVKAVETAAEITTNIHIKKVLGEAKDYIVEGRQMSEKFSEYDFFPPMVYNMVAVGERSGEIEKMFWSISDTLSSELETFISGITSLIEPILIVSIGALIFFIMLSVIVPILEINRAIM